MRKKCAKLRILIILLLWTVPTIAWAQHSPPSKLGLQSSLGPPVITHIGSQLPGQSSASGSSATTSAFNAILPGDSVVIGGQYGFSASITSVTDNAVGVTNNYIVQQSGLQWDTFGVYLFIVTGLNIRGSPTTLTFNFSASSGSFGIAGLMDEFSGVLGISVVTPYVNNTNTNPSASVTTTAQNCALVSLIADSVGFTSQPSGYTIGANDSAVNGMVNAYNLTSGAPGTYTAAWTDGSGNNAIGMVALIPQ